MLNDQLVFQPPLIPPTELLRVFGNVHRYLYEWGNERTGRSRDFIAAEQQ